MATAVVLKFSRISSMANGWNRRAASRSKIAIPPTREELVGMFPRSTAEDVDAAVDAAGEAFEPWRLVPAPKTRGDFVSRGRDSG